jgi:hypothetical protein
MRAFSGDLWPLDGRGTYASEGLDLIRSSVTYPSLDYWRRSFLFFGAKRESLMLMTGVEFSPLQRTN